LRDYKSTIPQLFWHNAIVILSNGHESRIGTTTSEWEHFTEQRGRTGSERSTTSGETRIGADIVTLTLGKLAHGIGVDATTVAVHGAWLAYGPAWVIETISMDASGARSAAVLSARDFASRAANFLTGTGAVAAGVVAAGRLAIGTAIRAAFRIAVGADAGASVPSLIAGTFDRFGSWGGPASGIGLWRSPAERGNSAQSQRDLDCGAA